jgi:hypothetical protein
MSAKYAWISPQFVLENMNGAKGPTGGKNHSNTFVLTAFNFFGQFNNFFVIYLWGSAAALFQIIKMSANFLQNFDK